MKKKNFFFMMAVSVIVLLLAAVSCSPVRTDLTYVDEEGNTSIDPDELDSTLDAIPAASLTAAEAGGILFMREEEKLARDVYLQLYDMWGTNTFNNIGSSEQTHMDAMKTLIDRYGLSDPAEGLGIGEFTDPVLQQLHDELIEQGSRSELDALKVGAAIEEIDIMDLEEYLQQTENQDIGIVYENLLKGSRNHLRSFVSVMENRGYTYEPQYISVDRYEDITGSDIETGGR